MIIKLNESYSDINNENVWEAYDIALEELGANNLCFAFAKAMGGDNLVDCLQYIFRQENISFGNEDLDESVDTVTNTYTLYGEDADGEYVDEITVNSESEISDGVKQLFANPEICAVGLYNNSSPNDCIDVFTKSTDFTFNEKYGSTKVNEGLTNGLELALQDFAQEYGGIDYRDIVELSNVWDSLDTTTKQNIKKTVSAIRKACRETGMDAYETAQEYPEDKENCDNLVKFIKDVIK